MPAAARVAPKSPNETLKPVPAPPPPRREKRPPRGGMLSLLSGLLTLGLAVAAVGVGGVLVVDHEVREPGPLPDDKVVLIPKGSGTAEITDMLTREGVIGSPTLFELYGYLNRSRGQLRAGEFLFRAHSSIDDAIDVLIQGKAILHPITAPEGLTSEQIVQRLRDSDVLAGDVRDIPKEGSLLPDTYRVERGTSRQQVLNLMTAGQRQALAQAWAKRAPDLGIRTPQELVILASIVEKETGRADERPHVASVFLNRLARRMKLQSDPTIVYGIVGGKATLGRSITRSEIDRPTPYNTYTIEGLPPGPIANPGRAAMEAVANPNKTRDLYFVADGTGGHAFAETYDQHLRNVGRWRQIERSRETGTPDPAAVDRVDPAASPETRSEGGPAASGSGGLNNLAAPAPGGRPRADASEGTALDPLASRNWDLTSPKSVPGFAAPPGESGGRSAAGGAARARPRP